MAGLIDKFALSVINERGLLENHRENSTAKQLAIGQEVLSDNLRLIAGKGSIDTILHAEGMLLQNDLENFTNSSAMKSSLETAAMELQVAVKFVEKVRDPERYKSTNEDHILPKNRTGGVPKDEARQFFRSHAARLLNQDRSRLSDTEKQILDQRRTNIRAAEKIYKTMQETALGITQGHNRGKASTITP